MEIKETAGAYEETHGEQSLGEQSLGDKDGILYSIIFVISTRATIPALPLLSPLFK